MASWHLGHIKPFSRMVVQVWQKSLRILVLLPGSFISEVTIWSISADTSAVVSMVRWLPLSLPTYLLTADCDNPKRSAVCFSFKPCFSTIERAIIAFTAGNTVFTPTSHGSIKFHTE
jgi:hypothetical protein